MATPTPSKPAQHQAMTPSSFATNMASLSPLPGPPRSVGQSPGLSKRSPANAIPLSQYHPSSSNAGASMTYDSPSAAALGLHLNMNLNLSLPSFDGVTSGNIRADEDERRRRIETILETLRGKVGRVGQEGIERLARRTGLDCLWEDAPDGARTLSMAGTALLIDVRGLPRSVLIFREYDRC